MSCVWSDPCDACGARLRVCPGEGRGLLALCKKFKGRIQDFRFGASTLFYLLKFPEKTLSKKNIRSGEILDLPLQKAVEDITGEESE